MYVPEQVDPQLTNPVLAVTEPEPDFATLRANVTISKFADTLRACVIDTVHVDDEPLHAPDHPVNTEPVAAEAVNVTDVP